MVFKRLGLTDIDKFSSFYNNANYRLCDYSVGTCVLWSDYYKTEYAIENGVLFSKLYSTQGELYYNLPLGNNLTEALKKISEIENGKTVKFSNIPECELETFKKVFPDCKISEEEDYADYLYNLTDLAYFAGKKYHSQRNMTKQFMRNNENFEYLPVSKQNANEVIDFLNNSYKLSETADSDELFEEKTAIDAVKHIEDYQFTGYMLKADNKVIGFSVGEVIGDTLFVHIEKADRNYKGAYQMLVSLFAKQFAESNVKYINREEDMGDEGLRKSKLSYKPISLLKKFLIIV